MDIERLCLSPEDAALALGVGRSKFWELMKDGEIPWIAIGRRRVVTREALAEFVHRQKQCVGAAPAQTK